MTTKAFAHEDSLTAQIRNRLKNAGECVWQRYPLPWTHPSFKSCNLAAQNLLSLFDPARTFLVMRDACLVPVRVTLLQRGKALIVPTRSGDTLMEIPGTALAYRTGYDHPVLRIEPPPAGACTFNGTVDVVVVSCLAFNRRERRLYTFELEKTAHALRELRSSGQVSRTVPVVCIAHDLQEVADWPASAQGYVEADMVVTPTRLIALGSGEEELIENWEGIRE